MEPDIFKIDEKTCYLIYKNFLVLNLPLDKVDECMHKLTKGKRYQPTSFIRYLIQNGGYMATMIHTINF